MNKKIRIVVIVVIAVFSLFTLITWFMAKTKSYPYDDWRVGDWRTLNRSIDNGTDSGASLECMIQLNTSKIDYDTSRKLIHCYIKISPKNTSIVAENAINIMNINSFTNDKLSHQDQVRLHNFRYKIQHWVCNVDKKTFVYNETKVYAGNTEECIATVHERYPNMELANTSLRYKYNEVVDDRAKKLFPTYREFSEIHVILQSLKK